MLTHPLHRSSAGLKDLLPGKAWWIKNKGNTSRHAALASNLHDFGVGDTITVEVDLDAGTCTFSKNGTELVNGLKDQKVVGPVSLWVNLDYYEQISIVEFEHTILAPVCIPITIHHAIAFHWPSFSHAIPSHDVWPG